MGVFVVTWNLNKERSNYAHARNEFIKHLERYPNIGEAGLESVRWIESSASANSVSEDLRLKMDKNDRLFVSKLVAASHAGWLNESTWAWISGRL